MAASVAALLGEDAARRIRLPIEQAAGLPLIASIWETRQFARHSPVADDVKLSPVWETNIHHFHNRLLDALR